MVFENRSGYGVDRLKALNRLSFVMSNSTPYKSTMHYEPKTGQNRFRVDSYAAHMLNVKQSICMFNLHQNWGAKVGAVR